MSTAAQLSQQPVASQSQLGDLEAQITNYQDSAVTENQSRSLKSTSKAGIGVQRSRAGDHRLHKEFE